MRGKGTGTVRNYFPAYRVFIYGVEVTKLCTSVRTNWPTNSPMQCSIELVNPNKLMTLTATDTIQVSAMRGMMTNYLNNLTAREFVQYFKDSPTGSFEELKGIYQLMEDKGEIYKFDTPWPPIPPLTDELCRLKETVITKKAEKGKYLTDLSGPDGNKLPTELVFKYPFYEGKWIWHFSDPVSVVFRDPVDPSIWYWAHRGTVTDISEKETEDKQSMLTITSEGVLKALRNARIMNATGAILTPTILGISEDAYFSLLSSSIFTNFLQRLTLRNILELMIFGSQSLINDLNERIHKGITFAELDERFGIIREGAKRTDRVTEKDVEHYQSQLRNLTTTGLNFKRWRNQQGVEVRILGGPVDSTDLATGESASLYEWQRLVDNRVRVTDVGTMLRQSLDIAQGDDAAGKVKSVTLSNEQEARAADDAIAQGLSINEVITRICSDLENYPINQRVRLLMPAHLGSRLKNDVVDQQLSGNLASTAEFFDRLSLLQQTLDHIEFVLYDSPRGDIVVEMPLYDFEPYHFSQSAADPLAFEDENFDQERQDAIAIASSEAAILRANEDSQQYEKDFAIFNFEQVSIDIASSEQDVKTAFIAQPRIVAAQAEDNYRQGRKAQVAVLTGLIPLYGVRVEQGGTFNAINTDEAARVYAQLMLNRTNADTVNMRVPCLPNWAAWLNRPIWIESRNIISTTKSIAHAIAWQSDANTDYGLWHSKFWDGSVTFDPITNQAKKLYMPFGGVNARPFNYAYLLGIRDRERDAARKPPSPAQAQAVLSGHVQSGRR